MITAKADYVESYVNSDIGGDAESDSDNGKKNIVYAYPLWEQ